MPTFKLYVIRETEYEVEAESACKAWDAYKDADETPDGIDELLGHYVRLFDEANGQVGPTEYHAAVEQAAGFVIQADAECSVCSRSFVLLSGNVYGCPVHGIRSAK